MNVFGIFAKRPQPGRVKTRIAAALGDELAAELHAAFVQDLIAAFRQTGDRRFLGYAPREADAGEYFRRLCEDDYTLWAQPETDLGGRMSAFFSERFERGGTNVVLIGSDSPTLPVESVDSAFVALETCDCVLGPATDGGYYLIGLRRPQPELFEGIEWSEAGVLRQTVERIDRLRLSLQLLRVWYDVDTPDDLEFLRGHLRGMELAGEELPAATAELLNRRTAAGERFL